jgi:endoglucanase
MFFVVSLLALWIASVADTTPTTAIKVDQVGYLPSAPKLAMVAAADASTADSAAARFSIRRTRDDAAVFEGALLPPVDDPDSGDRVRVADFSALRETGTFYIDVPGVGRSWTFTIGPGVYARTWYLAMRAFYGQRCNTTVDLGPEFPTYAHAACHLQGAWHASSGRDGTKPASGGWHDAGDYGRYVVNSGISTGTLLWMWELYGTRLEAINLNIPESHNRTPDVLDEIRWNLEWMLSMQDADGGVWHKQTSERFPAFVMPEDDKTVSHVIGTGAAPYKSSCATADLAAVMAIAARVYRPFDAAFATRTERAARDAWRWVEANPNVTFKNPADVVTGEYADRDCGDERLWAAAELWRSTRDARYQQYVLAHAAEHLRTLQPTRPPSWAQVAPLALWSYALDGRGDPTLTATIRQEAVNAARQIVARTARHGYRISMTSDDYIWGSNSVAANYGLQLLVAHAMQPDPAFVDTARDNLHYLLGRNTFSLSWVTQVGANPYRHPHHRPSGADRNAEPWPGLLSGGPNRSRQDPAMKQLPDLPPARMYLDEQASYASNEVAINWNAPLVFLLAGIDDRQTRVIKP